MATFATIADVRAIVDGLKVDVMEDAEVTSYLEKADAKIISRLAIPSGFPIATLRAWQEATTPPEDLALISQYWAASLIMLAVVPEADDDGQATRRSFRKIANDMINDLLSQKSVIIDSDDVAHLALGFDYTQDTSDDKRLFPRDTFGY